jgi:hypothetical protein
MESEWLRDAIRLSFNASIQTAPGDPKPAPPQRDPKREKLIDGLLYSRSFILTYHLVILGFVVILSVVHWSGKAIRWRKRRAALLRICGTDAASIEEVPRIETKSVQDYEGVSSSGSSTVEGTASPPQKDLEDEETPLLHPGHSPPSLHPRNVGISSMNAFLMYQPRPIPFLNKTLPANGTSIVILAFIGLNTFYTLFHIKFNVDELFVVADRFGLVFVANLSLLYILAAKNQPLKFLTGRSYESLKIFHRRLGELVCLEAFLHTSGMIAVWYTLIRPNGFGFIRFLLLPLILLGLGAFFSYEFLYFTSLASFRQRWYELFLGLHIVLQVAVLVLVFLHHKAGRPYVDIVLGIFLIDRLVYRLCIKSTTVRAYAKVMEDGETLTLSTTLALQRKPGILSLVGRSIKSDWQPTDHVFATVPALGQEHIIQAPPLHDSISSAHSQRR